MLRNICFQLQKETADQLQGKLEPLLSDLAAHGTAVSGLQESEKRAGADERRQAAGGLAACEKKREETMYLVDQGKTYNSLRAAGCYVLPVSHEANRGEVFPGALYVVEKPEETDFASLDMVYRRLAGLPWDILETDRLFVRETKVADVDAFYQIYAEPSVTEYMEELFEDRDEEIAYTKNYIEKVYAFYGYGMWTVLEKAGGEIIGRAGISWREGYSLPELGFVLGVPWQGKGFAYEVCRAILDYAGKELEMTRVQALVRPGNEKSLRLCEKLGFVLDGETEAAGLRHLVLVKEL